MQFDSQGQNLQRLESFCTPLTFTLLHRVVTNFLVNFQLNKLHKLTSTRAHQFSFQLQLTPTKLKHSSRRTTRNLNILRVMADHHKPHSTPHPILNQRGSRLRHLTTIMPTTTIKVNLSTNSLTTRVIKATTTIKATSTIRVAEELDLNIRHRATTRTRNTKNNLTSKHPNINQNNQSCLHHLSLSQIGQTQRRISIQITKQIVIRLFNRILLSLVFNLSQIILIRYLRHLHCLYLKHRQLLFLKFKVSSCQISLTHTKQQKRQSTSRLQTKSQVSINCHHRLLLFLKLLRSK